MLIIMNMHILLYVKKYIIIYALHKDESNHYIA